MSRKKAGHSRCYGGGEKGHTAGGGRGTEDWAGQPFCKPFAKLGQKGWKKTTTHFFLLFLQHSLEATASMVAA